MASMKKAKPSAENGSPITLPLNAMKPGQRRPSSNDSAVPETAPIAKISAKAFAQRRASASQTGSWRQSPMPSAANIKSGMPTPSTAKTMWNPSEEPMIARASVTLSTAAYSMPVLGRLGPVGSRVLFSLGGWMLQERQGERRGQRKHRHCHQQQVRSGCLASHRAADDPGEDSAGNHQACKPDKEKDLPLA